MKVQIYVGDQKLFESPGNASTLFDAGVLEVHDESDGPFETLFVYAMKQGQYAKIGEGDGVEQVRINE